MHVDGPGHVLRAARVDAVVAHIIIYHQSSIIYHLSSIIYHQSKWMIAGSLSIAIIHQGISLCSYENIITPSSQVTRLTCPSLPSMSFKLCVALLDPAHFSLCYKEINQITPLVNPSFLCFLCQNENYVIEASANHRITWFSPILINSKVNYSQIWALQEYELLQCDIS